MATAFMLVRLPLRRNPRLGSVQRCRTICSTAPSKGDSDRKRVVFLGSPSFAASSLRTLRKAENRLDFTVALVVTQPPQVAGRKRALTPTPVHMVAEELGIEVLAPVKASDPHFLARLDELKPDLCITAAYGNFLPSKFLQIPTYGTVNIHPSLLPAFRGAAPVPRALEAGVEKTGVTVMFTVLKMDAGPIVSQQEVSLTGDETAPELLDNLFDLGSSLVLEAMPSIFSRTVEVREQQHDDASMAPKMSKEEGRTVFAENAVRVHNKVRAFQEWPGVWADFVVEDKRGREEVLRLKLVRTRIHRSEGGVALGVHEVDVNSSKDALRIVCDDGSVLDLLLLQPQGRKVMDAKSFKGGLQGKTMRRKRIPH